MENTTNGTPQNNGLPNQEPDRTNDNTIIPTHVEATASDDIFTETAPVKIISLDDTTVASHKKESFDDLPYEDPAVVNPAELASFPKAAPKVDAADVENESGNRLVNRKSSPVREGRNIAQSDNRPDENGYI